MHDDDFPAVLAGAQARDGDAVRVLFDEFQPRLIRYLRARVGNADDAAADLAADVWLAVASSIDRFHGDLGQFRGWLFTIARNRLTDLHRRRGRRVEEPLLDDVDAVALMSDQADADPAAITIDELSGREVIDLLRAHLSADQLEVVVLRAVADLDVGQVAAMLGRPETWVRVTYHRAMQRLATRVGARLRESPDESDVTK